MSEPRDMYIEIHDGEQIIMLEISTTYESARRVADIIKKQVAFSVIEDRTWEEVQPLPPPTKPNVVHLPANVTAAGIEERIQMYNRLDESKPPFVADAEGDGPPPDFFSGDWIPEAYKIQEAQGTLKPASPYSVVDMPLAEAQKS